MSSSMTTVDKNDKHAVVDDVNRMYDDDRPFWTIERLLDIAQKLARVRNGGRGVVEIVTTIGIDGSEAEHPIMSHKIVAAERGEAHDTVYIPIIKYINVQEFMMDIQEDFYAKTAYHNLQVSSRQIGYHTAQGIIPMHPVRTHAEVEAVLKDDKLEWEGTPGCQQLIPQLKYAIIPPGIDKIIGFGFGSIAETWDNDRLHHISAYQHALLLTVREIISKRQGNVEGIKCYVQDPAYMDADRTALADVGITVVDDPNGFVRVDDSTIVISIGPSVCVKQIVADLARPAMLIWEKQDPDEDPDDRADFADPYCHRVTELVDDYYDKLPFAGETGYFGPLAVFVRNRE